MSRAARTSSHSPYSNHQQKHRPQKKQTSQHAHHAESTSRIATPQGKQNHTPRPTGVSSLVLSAAQRGSSRNDDHACCLVAIACFCADDMTRSAAVPGPLRSRKCRDDRGS
jgi:hypothetical protein